MIERINSAELDLKEKVVHINRVAKVIKGGRRFSFNAIIVVGDGNGHVGIGHGKAREVTGAIAKATEKAKKNLIYVPIIKGTIPHPITMKYGAGKVILKPASAGTGLIAGGPVRALCEAVGIQDILTKSLGSSNPHNVTKATFNAFRSLMDVVSLSKKRGLKISEIFNG